MLRRLETYGFHPDTTSEQVDDLARVLRRTGWFIPEVLNSAVGRNRSSAGVDLVWEHSYESPAAYARYMCHPYHICILDRYLLPEAPECITASRRELQLGLMGYEIDGAPFRRDHGIRRIVALKMASEAEPSEIDGLAAEMMARPATVPGMTVSIVAPNTMGLEWFPTGWTHVWEQAYEDDAAMARAVADEPVVLSHGPVAEWVDVHYVIEREDAPRGDDRMIFLVESVDVRPDDVDAYVAGFEAHYLPGALDRGMELVGCWHTPTNIGEDVTVTVIFGLPGWAEWEQIRNAAVGDPSLGVWVALRRDLMLRGSRKFYEPAALTTPVPIRPSAAPGPS